MAEKFDPFSEIGSIFKYAKIGSKIGSTLGTSIHAARIRPKIEAEFGTDVANAVIAAIKAGRDPTPIIEQARRAKKDAEEREELLRNPPPIHGSARWANGADLSRFLKSRDAFDTPSSILFGYFEEDDNPLSDSGHVHWDEDGHLVTVARTRSGKAVTTIIPNLLRYQGSAIVLDPKGELYAATSKWRSENVGPVYRLAPFDNGGNPETANFPRHGFNPLSTIKSQADARKLAELLFPRDPRTPEFFTDDAASLVTALILFTLEAAPPNRQHLGVVRQQTALAIPQFKARVRRMQQSGVRAVVEAANNVLGKSGDRGLPNLRDTLHSKLSLWSDEQIVASLRTSDFTFESLKDQPATVYIEIPFDLMSAYAPWLRVVLKSALDAMLRNPTLPEIPVLFVLDEFLQLGPFPEFRDAIRSHAGAGVRLWFFLQDMASLEENYPQAGWKPFLNCEVKQFFGVNDPDTAELVGRFLGQQTLAWRTTNSGSNVSAQQGDWLGNAGNTGVSFSDGETIQFAGRPLLTPDEVMELLGTWQGSEGWRWSIVHMSGPRPFKSRLVVWDKSSSCRDRYGAYRISTDQDVTLDGG